jgi:molybdopterin molybdotransferase
MKINRLGDTQMITLEEAFQLHKDTVSILEPKDQLLEEAIGCVLAQTVLAPMNQPPFPRSPYDGYAFQSVDSQEADKEHPVRLEVVGQSYAGKPYKGEVLGGTAVRIMTGAVIPKGADCVIRQEDTDLGEKWVQVYLSLKKKDNYCDLGEDFKCNDLILPKGIELNASALAVAGQVGYTKLPVFPHAKVALISTGDELQIPGISLEQGQIYDSNMIYLEARLKELKETMVYQKVLRDDEKELSNAFQEAVSQADFVITTGGVSVGQHDYVAQVLNNMGAKLIYHGVDMKPGMPVLFAMLQGKPVLALSGNPFAATVNFEMLARSILSLLTGNEKKMAAKTTAILKEEYTNQGKVRRFLRGRLENGVVSFPKSQRNGQMQAMIGCNCIIDLNQSKKYEAMESVTVYLLER